MIEDAREIGERVGISLDTANKLCQSISKLTHEIAEVFLEKFQAWWRGFRHHSPKQIIFKQGGRDMGDKGKKDKGKREQQKKAQLNPKEKRKKKKEKKK